MSARELRAEIIRAGISIPELAAMMNISSSTLYSKIRCEREFTQGEISKISELLRLSPDRIMSIFFASMVS